MSRAGGSAPRFEAVIYASLMSTCFVSCMDKLAEWIGRAPLVAAVAVGLATPLGILIGQNAPDPGAPVLVLSAPWDSAERVAESASGYLILPGRISSIGLVHSSQPEFLAALGDAGAWLILNGRLSGAFCASK